MKFVDISGLSIDQLKRKAVETKAELFQMKMKNVLGQLGNPLEIRYKRKDMAKIQTAISQKTEK